jgi:hypothetical protein
MELVRILSVRPGQVLARDVANTAGAVLCPAGSRLTRAVIERLKTAGIDSVVIEGVDNRGPTPQERLDVLRRRFAGVDDPILLQVKATIENRLQLMCLERAASK